MKVFLIILTVIILLFIIILSLSAQATVVYDGRWKTTVQILFFKKDVELSKILNFVLFPDKAGKEAAENSKKKKNESKKDSNNINQTNQNNINEHSDLSSENDDEQNKKTESAPVQQPKHEEKTKQKKNPVAKIIDEDGIVGIMTLASNLLETLNTAVITLFKGLHIYSLYVKIIVGGGDAADIAKAYGDICAVYYPLKGIILNGMKVDMYDDYIQPDFIAPCNEYEFQIIASMNVALILKVGIKAGYKFLINLIKNK